MKRLSIFEQALINIEPLLRKTTFEIYRSNKHYLPEVLPEDYGQDIKQDIFIWFKRYEKFTHIGQDPLGEKSVDDLTHMMLARIPLEKRHFLNVGCRYSNGKLSGHNVVNLNGLETENSQGEQVDSFDSALARQDDPNLENYQKQFLVDKDPFNQNLLKEIKKWEKTAPGVTKFVRESISPTATTLVKFEDYKKNMLKNNRILRNMDGGNIPPVVLMELIGDNRNRISSFKRVIAFAMVDLGVSADRIINSWNLADLYFKNRVTS